MARHLFDVSLAGWTFGTATADGVANLAQLTGGVEVTFFNAETGGAQQTDLLDTALNPITSVTTEDGSGTRAIGAIPPFWGPDGVWALWAEAAAGPRALIEATDAGAHIDAAASAAATASGNLSAHVAEANPHGTTFDVLDDVDMTGLIDGQVPVWDATAARWEPGTPSGGSGSTGSTAVAAFLVASSTMPQAVKDAADYVCDATADEVQINAAITAAAGQGNRAKVVLTGGRFNVAAPILMRTGVWLQGSGPLTELRAVSITGATGAGSAVAVVKQFDINAHLHHISDLWINGNGTSGGAGHGICYESATSGDDLSAYPDSNPDPDIGIRNLYISNFGNGSTRCGIVCRTDMRGTIIQNLQMRSFSLHGIWMDGTPDSHIANVHLGTVTGTGYLIAGGNVKLTNCKSFYCDSWGFDMSSGRGSLTGCESQDNANGVRITATRTAVTGMIIDTCETTSLSIGANYGNYGVTIFNRGNGRYATTASGIVWSGTPTNTHLNAVVDTSDLTTAMSGTHTGAGNWVRVSHGGTLTTHGT